MEARFCVRVSTSHRAWPQTLQRRRLCATTCFANTWKLPEPTTSFKWESTWRTLAIREPTYFEIWQPLVGYGTESYADNDAVLEHIKEKIEDRIPGNKLTIIVGDQQTFDRMMKLRKYQPIDYAWLVPMAGEMHFCAFLARRLETVLVEAVAVGRHCPRHDQDLEGGMDGEGMELL